MKRIFFIAALFVGVSIFTSCDNIDDPVIPINLSYNEELYGPPPTFGAPANTNRVALLEDFTAHQCGNCPSAAIIANDLKEQYGESVVLMAIHAGSLADFNDVDPFSTDWTNDVSELYFSQLDFQANPLGRVNRYPNQGTILSPSEWGDNIDSQISEQAEVNLQMIVTHESENNHVNIHVNGQYAQDVTGELKLTVLVLESHMIDYQLDYDSSPELIPDSEHNHVLRGPVNAAEGLNFSTDAVAGDEVQKDYTYVWENSDWDVNNSSIVAFVYNPQTGEVLNAIEKYIVP